jgi:excreted virulence factor EspC (type VII ESX diderm)
MGENESAHVDVGVLLDGARRCEAVADLVDGLVRGHLEGLTFDGAVAGADRAACGDAVRRAVDGVVDQVLVWARATREIAAALASSGHRYADVDARGASRLG